MNWTGELSDDAARRQAGDAVLEALFDPQTRPVLVRVDQRVGQAVARMPVAEMPHRHFVPAVFVFFGVVSLLMIFGIASGRWPEPFFTLGLLYAVVQPVAAAAMATGVVMGWSAVRANMVARVVLEPHQITFRGPHDNEIWTGSLHTIQEVWAASDTVSAVLGLKVPELLALRVADPDVAIWLRDLLHAWQRRYGRTADGDAEVEMARLARAMGVATVSSRDPG